MRRCEGLCEPVERTGLQPEALPVACVAVLGWVLWLQVGEVSDNCMGDLLVLVAIAVLRGCARCSVGPVLCIVGIVQWNHPRPRQRGAGVQCPGWACLWRPAMGSSCVVINTYLSTI